MYLEIPAQQMALLLHPTSVDVTLYASRYLSQQLNQMWTKSGSLGAFFCGASFLRLFVSSFPVQGIKQAYSRPVRSRETISELVKPETMLWCGTQLGFW